VNKTIYDALPYLEWEAKDPRWTALAHFISRVQDAGIALVSRADRERLIERHLIPSVEHSDLIPESGRLLDVGSGGGFPGLPIAFARPDLEVTLMDSSSRKTAFLRRVSRETSLSNVNVVTSRVEDMAPHMTMNFDIITARAVALIPEIVDWTQLLLAEGGKWLLWKGRLWREEGELEGWGVKLVEERELSDGGRLLVIEPI
jgi:16S rRNA (guanine527-N7)-methyltransferase